jgi:hypothetical protein
MMPLPCLPARTCKRLLAAQAGSTKQRNKAKSKSKVKVVAIHQG